jgi:hypothetical protein
MYSVDEQGRHESPLLLRATSLRKLTHNLRIADFLQLRLKTHPIFIGLRMCLEGLPLKFTRADLARFAARKALVAIRPDAGDN